MGLFGRRGRHGRDDAPSEKAQQEARELLDQYHPRASTTDGEQIVIAPGKVLDNIELAMERVDNDIDTPVSIEDDVVPLDELATLIEKFMMGPTLAVTVVNTALKIMAARYPTELVRAPLPVEYDLRAMVPLELSDHVHDVAKTIFNRRTLSAVDLTEGDIATEMSGLDIPEQITTFVALFYMFGTKVGALKYRTGIK